MTDNPAIFEITFAGGSKAQLQYPSCGCCSKFMFLTKSIGTCLVHSDEINTTNIPCDNDFTLNPALKRIDVDESIHGKVIIDAE